MLQVGGKGCLAAEGADVPIGLLSKQAEKRIARGEQKLCRAAERLNLCKGALGCRDDLAKGKLPRGVADVSQSGLLAVGLKKCLPDLLAQGKRKKGLCRGTL